MVVGIENLANVVLSAPLSLFRVKRHKADELARLFQTDSQEIITPGKPFCNSLDFLR